MTLASEDAGIWILPIVLLLGLAAVSPFACAVLAGRVFVRIARSAAGGDIWTAFTPGTWLLAAASSALGAGFQISLSVYGLPAAWAAPVSFVCGCFALAALAMSGLTAALNRHLKNGATRM